ncbi:uncharacterized protein LOC126892515 [Diabrotica virgifera virgifera]|uniref:DUF7869 domain-containing protein n=1 Tax=Diabrotica virgifera virgifera TaxID=50390 RepID=A0ABM5L6F8_DIAVI|nr:uncharacterized protein LOC126892515 [Diabrotica virgifera virgifera]
MQIFLQMNINQDRRRKTRAAEILGLALKLDENIPYGCTSESTTSVIISEGLEPTRSQSKNLSQDEHCVNLIHETTTLIHSVLLPDGSSYIPETNENITPPISTSQQVGSLALSDNQESNRSYQNVFSSNNLEDSHFQQLNEELHTENVITERASTPSTSSAHDFSPSESSYNPESDSSETESEDRVSEENSVPDSELVPRQVYFGEINEERKRKIKPDSKTWKKNRNKELRMLGKDYLGYTNPKEGKMLHNTPRSARKLGEACKSKKCTTSKVRNCEKLTVEMRQDIFNNFWTNLNWEQRKIYINGLVSRQTTARKTVGCETRREGTFQYFLPTAEGNLRVCKTSFLNTFSLGSFTVQSWVKKSVHKTLPCNEVTNSNRKRVVPRGTATRIQMLREFFKNIPTLPSHYNRKNSRKLFIEPYYRNKTELYNSYKIWCSNNNEESASRHTFDKIFKDSNLSIYTLKKDMCDICVSYKEGNISDEKYKDHIQRKSRARAEKEHDKEKAQAGEFNLLTMDLEAVKVCPYLTASALYFKTKLSCHNYTVYNLVTHHATCYWFDETASDLTASTFVNFLLDYLSQHCLANRLPIVIFSDGCTYQNRNNILSNALSAFSVKYQIVITQKFLEPGHTQMECDSVHSAIETKLKHREIHLPSDYASATKEARSKPFPYEVKLVDYQFFKNYANEDTWRYTSIRPGRKVGDPVVTDLRALLYTIDGKIQYKLNFDDEWSELPIRPKIIPEPIYTPLHDKVLPISSTKYSPQTIHTHRRFT